MQLTISTTAVYFYSPLVRKLYGEFMASKKEKRYAINYVLDLAGSVECKDLHHKKKHRHSNDEFCAAEYHRDKQIYLVREMLKDLDV